MNGYERVRARIKEHAIRQRDSGGPIGISSARVIVRAIWRAELTPWDDPSPDTVDYLAAELVELTQRPA